MTDYYTKEERAIYNARYYRVNKGKVNRRDYYTKEQRASYNAKRKNSEKVCVAELEREVRNVS